MKLIYSHLKKFLPDLNVEPQKLRDDLTMIGHFANFYEIIKSPPLLKGGSPAGEGDFDFFIDLDIKINRGDALGYYGLARDLSVYYKIPLVLPQIDNQYTSNTPDFKVTSPDVIRVMTAKVSGVKVSSSPDWLKSFLQTHDINSINNLVDLSNYIMLLYGIPCHTFDDAKVNGTLTWENNTGLKYPQFTTLDGTIFNLTPANLLLTNQKEALSTDFLGGRNSGVDQDTQATFVEMAVYNRTRVRLDSQELKTRTESGIRLEKDLDPDTIPLAFNHLIKLIQETCGGQITTGLGDYYPNPITPPEIEFDPQSPSVFSGIEIPADFALDSLTRLGCTVIASKAIYSGQSTGKQSLFHIIPPTIRKDITQTEDLIEEVVRFWGYNQIPINQPLAHKQVQDITPPILTLIDSLKDKLTKLGYDEVRTWPMTQSPLDPNTVVTTQNSINSEYPHLRQSICQTLIGQLDQYTRYKLPQPQFFEIGKVFSQTSGQFEEHYSLGIYNYSTENLKSDLEKLGLKSDTDNGFAEINLDTLPQPSHSYIPNDITNTAHELTGQIITLDANVTHDHQADPLILIKEFSQKIGDSLWQLVITDIYHDTKSGQYRYTFRASYFNLDDKTAKDLHLKTFGLK